ncbi:glycosyltransferase family 4 protein [Thermodesulfobacteriota bacterium]
MRLLFLTKRQYMGKDLLDDSYGRFFEIPAELAKQGHQLQGLTLSYRPRPEGNLKGPTIDSTPVDWHSINLGRLFLPGFSRYLKKITRLINEFTPDVIIAGSDAIHAIIGVRIARQHKIPCVVDLYDNFESFGLTKLPGVLSRFRISVSLADGVTCVSENLTNHIVKKYNPTGKVITIENGIPPNLFRPMDKQKCREKFGLPKHARIIGTAGALGANRGIDILFKGFQELNAANPSIHLALAGPLEPGIRLPTGPKVHHMGNLQYQDVPIFINALDIGIICNIDTLFGRYCFPQKAYEMMACGIPVVAAKVGAMAELLAAYPECLFEPENQLSFIKTIENQIIQPSLMNLPILSWPELAIKFNALLNEIKK